MCWCSYGSSGQVHRWSACHYVLASDPHQALCRRKLPAASQAFRFEGDVTEHCHHCQVAYDRRHPEVGAYDRLEEVLDTCLRKQAVTDDPSGRL